MTATTAAPAPISQRRRFGREPDGLGGVSTAERVPPGGLGGTSPADGTLPDGPGGTTAASAGSGGSAKWNRSAVPGRKKSTGVANSIWLMFIIALRASATAASIG